MEATSLPGLEKALVAHLVVATSALWRWLSEAFVPDEHADTTPQQEEEVRRQEEAALKAAEEEAAAAAAAAAAAEASESEEDTNWEDMDLDAVQLPGAKEAAAAAAAKAEAEAAAAAAAAAADKEPGKRTGPGAQVHVPQCPPVVC